MNPDRRRRFGLIAALLVVMALAVVPFVIYNLSRARVTLTVDGRVQHLRTRADTVQAVLDDAGIRIEFRR